MMHTNTNKTHEILNSYTNNAGALDLEYIAHCIIIVADNNETTRREKLNTRRKPRAVAVSWLMYWINTELYYNYGRGLYATNKQVMQWDRTHAGQLEKVLDAVETYIQTERDENN